MVFIQQGNLLRRGFQPVKELHISVRIGLIGIKVFSRIARALGKRHTSKLGLCKKLLARLVNQGKTLGVVERSAQSLLFIGN